MSLFQHLSVSSGGAVLCFHGLTTAELPSEGIINLPLTMFAELVKAVRQVGTIVPLSEMLREHQAKRSTRGLVAITFDDGYASLLQATDLVRAESIFLTVFVTTNASSGGTPFWWDRLDDLHPRVDPGRWRAFEDEIGLSPEYRQGQPPEYGPVRPLRQWILSVHRGRWPSQLEAPLAALEQEAGFRTPHRAMTFGELVTFGELPSVEYGVHTLSHPVLPLLQDEEAIAEIADCHTVLRQRLGRVEPILAIPYGLFDARTDGQARRAGMSASLTLAGRTWGAYAGESGLPRFGVNRREKTWKLRLRITGLAERLFGGRLEGGRSYPALPSATT